MGTRVRALVILALSTCICPSAYAQDAMHPWQLSGENITEGFGWPNLLFHVAAGTATGVLAFGGVDRAVQDWFQKSDPLGGREPALLNLEYGFWSPIVIAGGLYGGGLAVDDPELTTAGAAVTQAVVLTGVFVLLLKRLTDRAAPYRDGRAPPEGRGPRFMRRTGDPTDWHGDPSEYRRGIMWPSGHTASHFAIAAALTAFYPELPWMGAITYPIATLMGLYMVEGDFHWFSDVVAGALMGHVIGWVIGRNFREAFDDQADPIPTTEVLSAPPPVFSAAFPLDL